MKKLEAIKNMEAIFNLAIMTPKLLKKVISFKCFEPAINQLGLCLSKTYFSTKARQLMKIRSAKKMLFLTLNFRTFTCHWMILILLGSNY